MGLRTKNKEVEKLLSYLGALESKRANVEEGRKFLTGKTDFSNLSHLASIVREYCIIALDILFQENNNDNISLVTLPRHFKKSFNHKFFQEYESALKSIKEKYADQIERVRKNRNLGLAHIGTKEELGLAKEFQKLEWLDDYSILAKDEHHSFILKQDIVDGMTIFGKGLEEISLLITALRTKISQELVFFNEK